MAASTRASEIWQARIPQEFATQLHDDAKVLGLDGRTDIVRAALRMLHQRAAEERMAHDVDDFYSSTPPPLPIGVVPADDADS